MTPAPEEPATAHLPSSRMPETDHVLLGDTQTYLKAVLENLVPDTLLVEAWAQFYRVYSRLVERFAIARGVPPTEVSDCVQEVWAEVIRCLPYLQYNPNRHGLRAWLYTLVRSKAAMLARRRGRHAAHSLQDATQAEREPECQGADMLGEHERLWKLALVETLLAELRSEVSDLNFRLLQMRLIEGKSVPQVAAALNLTREQVRYRHYRMLRKLRAQVAVYTGKQPGE